MERRTHEVSLVDRADRIAHDAALHGHPVDQYDHTAILTFIDRYGMGNNSITYRSSASGEERVRLESAYRGIERE